MEKSSLRLQVSRLSCTASAAVRSISMSMAKRQRSRGCPLCPYSLPGRLAGAGCRPAGARHPKKQPGKAGAVGGHPGTANGLCPDAAGVEAYPSVWGQHRGVVCYAGVADAKPEKALLVSPVVDMEKLILALMQQAGVTEEQLRAAGEIPTDFGETLSWPYLCWVREHPLHWKVPTQVLYADTDPLTGHTAMEQFRQQTRAHLTILEGGEHWFHTETQLAALQSWESCHL